MTTGKKAASDAARQLGGKKSTPKEREVAGSDLAQAKQAAVRKAAKKAPVKPVAKQPRKSGS